MVQVTTRRTYRAREVGSTISSREYGEGGGVRQAEGSISSSKRQYEVEAKTRDSKSRIQNQEATATCRELREMVEMSKEYVRAGSTMTRRSKSRAGYIQTGGA